MVLCWVLSVLLVGTAGFLAGREVAGTTEASTQPPGPSVYTVETGVVSDRFSLGGRAVWPLTPAAAAVAGGVVTTVDVAAMANVSVGTRLFTVNLRPVVIAAGAVPAFRDIGGGARGPDVEQLQDLLVASGQTVGSRGLVDARTIAAIRAWQGQSGYPLTGVVSHGDIVFVPTLPGRILLDPAVRVGASVAPGSTLVSVPAAAPVISLELDQQQAQLVPVDVPVEVVVGEFAWAGIVASVGGTDSGGLLLTLGAADGGPICASDCAALPIPGPTPVGIDVVAVPDTTGPVVPVSALVTGPEPTVQVIAEDGTELPVTVVVSARGLAVVDGVEPGTVILVNPDDD